MCAQGVLINHDHLLQCSLMSFTCIFEMNFTSQHNKYFREQLCKLLQERAAARADRGEEKGAGDEEERRPTVAVRSEYRAQRHGAGASRSVANVSVVCRLRQHVLHIPPIDFLQR